MVHAHNANDQDFTSKGLHIPLHFLSIQSDQTSPILLKYMLNRMCWFDMNAFLWYGLISLLDLDQIKEMRCHLLYLSRHHQYLKATHQLIHSHQLHLLLRHSYLDLTWCLYSILFSAFCVCFLLEFNYNSALIIWTGYILICAIISFIQN